MCLSVISLVGYIKIHDSRPPSAPKGNSKFEILLVKIFSPKQKSKLNTSSYQKKTIFSSSRKQPMVPLDKGLQWVNVKQKLFRQIQAHSATIRDIQELFRHIQAYSESCVTPTCLEPWYIHKPGIFKTRSIFRTLAYSQSQYIQNSAIFKTLAYSNSEAYLEPCQTSAIKCFANLVNGYNYFNK